MKKLSKITICLFMILSFLFVGNVKAEDGVTATVNAEAGIGGKENCDPWSHVCIINLAAIRISIYENNQTLIAYDIYDSGAYGTKATSDGILSSLKTPKNNVLSKTKKGYNSNGIIVMPIYGDDFSKTFISTAKQKKYYKNIVKEFKKSNSNIRKNLLLEIGVDESYIATHKKAKIIIEPLFRVKIQNVKNALAVYRDHSHAQAWEYYIGTATNVAEKVIAYGNDHKCEGTYQAAFCDRKKPHVKRMGESLTLDKTEIGIKKPTQKLTNKSSMKLLNNYDIGYGVGIVKLKLGDGPNDKQYNYKHYCYSIEKTKACSIDSNTAIDSTDVTEENAYSYGEISMGNPVDNNQRADGNAYYNGVCEKKGMSSSEYGEQVLKINSYCSLYCTKTINATLPSKILVGQNPSSSGLGNSGNSNDYNDQMSIFVDADYTCKVDFNYFYDDYWSEKNAIQDQNQNPIYSVLNQIFAPIKTGIGFERYTWAEANTSNFLNNYRSNKDSQDAKTAYESTSEDIRRKIIECTNYSFTPDKIAKKINLGVKYNNKTVELKEELSSECVNCEGQNDEYVVRKINNADNPEWTRLQSEYIEYSGGTNSDWAKNYGSSYGGVFLLLNHEKNLLARPEINISFSGYYTPKYKYKYDLNTSKTPKKTEEDNSYAVTDNDETNSDENRVCFKNLKVQDVDISESNDGNVNVAGMNADQEIDITADGICDDTFSSKIYYNKDAKCACPSETLNAGVNAYYWAANNELSGDMKEKFDNGLNCASATALVCNNTELSKTKPQKYEPIISESGDGFVDSCLAAGQPLSYCKRESHQYYCVDNTGDTISCTRTYYETIANGGSEADAMAACKKQCTCDGKGNKKIVYRTVKLGIQNEAFPGLKGTGRKPGSNWNDPNTIKTVITDTSDTYDKKNPMYKIVLNYESIKKIRDYNDRNSYDDFNMDCGSNGEGCVSEFLNNEITVEGKCANVNKTASSFYGAGCVNYNARGE